MRLAQLLRGGAKLIECVVRLFDVQLAESRDGVDIWETSRSLHQLEHLGASGGFLHDLHGRPTGLGGQAVPVGAAG